METTISLKKQWEELKTTNPKIRIRNAAEELGVSEAELLATQCGGEVTRLRPEFQAILGDVPALGYVMALTRNNDVVHERKGHYLNPTLDNPHVGLFVGEDIDLRIFFSPWASAYAVTETAGDKPRHSLQFFAVDGEAIHKIYLTPSSNKAAYDELVKKYTHSDQGHEQETKAWPAPDAELPDSEIDVNAFREGWLNLKDTHNFFGLVKKHKLTRTQALRLAPEGDYAVKVNNHAMRSALKRAADSQTPIMVFVGNKGMIQIHTGPVNNLLEHQEWYNVLDPAFNLHVRETGITETWVVRKPTDDGMVTAIECFDKTGNQIVQFFGKRKPGIPELEDWRTIVKDVEKECVL